MTRMAIGLYVLLLIHNLITAAPAVGDTVMRGMPDDYTTGKEVCTFYDLFGRRVSLDQEKLHTINVLVQKTDLKQRTRHSIFLTVADIFR